VRAVAPDPTPVKVAAIGTLADVVPLDPSLVRGSHGLSVTDPADRPVLLGDGPAPALAEVPQAGVRRLLLQALGVADR